MQLLPSGDLDMGRCRESTYTCTWLALRGQSRVTDQDDSTWSYPSSHATHTEATYFNSFHTDPVCVFSRENRNDVCSSEYNYFYNICQNYERNLNGKR